MKTKKQLRTKKVDLINKVKRLPNLPGVYHFYNKEGEIIYIGKAKDIKKRVSSYFQNKKNQSSKNLVMIKHIIDFEWILVRSEVEALITEANLIKKHRPRYNIDLKDDKSFPFIKISNELYPQVILTRKVIKDGSKYFGPFTDVKVLRNIIKVLKNTFQIRSCSFDLNEEVVKKKTVPLCLDYHIKKCEGPCQDLVSKNKYFNMIKRVEAFMKGDTTPTVNYLSKMMLKASSQERFEDAALFRDQLNSINQFKNKQSLITNDLKERDVIVLALEKDFGISVIIRVRNGRIFSREKVYLRNLRSDDNDTLKSVITRFYINSDSVPEEISLQIRPNEESFLQKFLYDKRGSKVRFSYPKIGQKAKELRVTLQNAKLLLKEWKIKKQKQNKYVPRVLTAIQKDLSLKLIPKIIEAFDISHHNGENTVASMVYFKDSKPVKREYRRYNIKSVTGIDDFLSIYEVVYRRYSRVINEKRKLPNLILIDGGKGQLNSAIKALKDLKIKNIAIIGLAKRLEEIYLPNNSEPQSILKNSPSLLLLRRIRDEAHRFAITHHRKRQLNTKINSRFIEIKGIGKKKLKLLYEKFDNYESIANTNPKELKKVLSISLDIAKNIIFIASEMSKNSSKL